LATKPPLIGGIKLDVLRATYGFGKRGGMWFDKGK
jgi:hypothetical protein